MEIKTLTIEEFEHVAKSNDTFYNIEESVLKALIFNKSGLMLVDAEGKILGAMIGNMQLIPDGTSIVYKCIFVSGSIDSAKRLLRHANTIFEHTVVTESCMRYVKAKYTKGGEWYKYEVETPSSCGTTPLVNTKSKVYLDKKCLEIVNDAEKLQVILKNPRPANTYFTDEEKKRVVDIENKLVKHTDGVWSFPVLSNVMLKKILRLESKCAYEVNSHEAYEVQIPEVLIEDVDMDMYKVLHSVFLTVVNPLSEILYMKEICEVKSIQLAKYSGSTVSEGTWHFDADSDVTLVVNISTDKTEGGTLLKPFGSSEEIYIPPLEPGYGLLFRGRVFMHKGCKTKNDRKILVFWTN